MKYPTKWNLDLLFKDTPANVKKEREKFKKGYSAFIKKWKKRSDYLKEPKVLKMALAQLENLETKYDSNEMSLLHLKEALNSDDSKIKARINTARDFYLPIANDMNFFTLNVSKVPVKVQKKFLKSPLLKDYKHLLEGLFESAKHLLSEPEEKIMTLKNSVSYSNWVKMTSSFIEKEEREVLNENGKKEKATEPKIFSLLKSAKGKVREASTRAIYDILEKHSNVAEMEMNSILQNKKINDELRKYERPDSARHKGDDIDSKVVDLLADRVSKHFKTSKDFYVFRNKLAKLKKATYYDRFTSVSKESGKKYSYVDAILIVRKALANLDSEFEKIFMDFVQNGHIDVYPQKGKSGGAFCSSGGKLDPTYILLNFNGILRDISTIAHEVGHGINAELIKKSEKPLTVGHSLATAEIASTFMEDFVLEEASKDLNDEERLNLLLEKLDDEMATIFRQIAAYKFEQELHQSFRQQGYLPKSKISEIFTKHMKNYLGESFKFRNGGELDWIRWGHFRKFFYNYSYASGLLISKYLQAKVKEDPRFIEKVKKFLSTGTSKSPKNILQELGVDISRPQIWDRGLKEVENNLKEAKRLAKKLGRI